MTSYRELKDAIMTFAGLIEFTYNGKECNIDPYSPTDFHIYCGGEEWDATSIEEVMTGKFFDGACLRDIVSKIQSVKW